MSFNYVMKFGVRALIEHGDVASEEMTLAHRYYNALIELRREETRRYNEIRSKFVPGLIEAETEYDALDAEVEAVKDAIREARRRASAPTKRGKKIPATGDQMKQLTELKAKRRTAGARRKELRAQFTEMLSAGDREFDRRTSGASKSMIAKLSELGARLKAAKKIRNNPEALRLQSEFNLLKEQKNSKSPKTHKKAEANEAAFAEMMTESWPEAWKAVKSLRVEVHERANALRSTCGCQSGTYSAVEDAVKKAIRTTQGDLRFRRWDGGRKVGVQIQKRNGKYLTGAEVIAGTDSRLRIVNVQELRGRKDGTNPSQGGKRRRDIRYAVVQMRIGKNRWLSAEVVLHRPIPENAEITWFYLVPRRIGFRRVMTAQFTVRTEEPLVKRRFGHGKCSVRIRWSKTPDEGIVVAEVNGEPFAMRPNEFARMRKSRAVRGEADEHFDTMRAELIGWMAENKAPDWLKRECAAQPATEKSPARGAIHQWRAHSRLARVAKLWIESSGLAEKARDLWRDWLARCEIRYRTREERRSMGPLRAQYYPRLKLDFEAWRVGFFAWLFERGLKSKEEQMALLLEWWRRKDQHLVQYAADLDAKARGARKDWYRCKAAELTRRFSSVEVHGIDLAAAARRKAPDRDADEIHREARYQRTAAAPSEFVECLKLAFGKERFCERSRADGSTGGARASDQVDVITNESVEDAAAE